MGDDRLQRRCRLLELLEVGQGAREAGDALEGLLHGMRGAQYLAVAAEAAHYLQAERHLLVVDAAGQRHGGIACQRDEVLGRHPVVVVVEFLAVHLVDVELLPREGREARVAGEHLSERIECVAHLRRMASEGGEAHKSIPACRRHSLVGCARRGQDRAALP